MVYVTPDLEIKSNIKQINPRAIFKRNTPSTQPGPTWVKELQLVQRKTDWKVQTWPFLREAGENLAENQKWASRATMNSSK